MMTKLIENWNIYLYIIEQKYPSDSVKSYLCLLQIIDYEYLNLGAVLRYS